MIRLHVVRHGRTAAHAAGQLLGHRDPPLDPEGVAQAAALAAVLPTGARVVSSPLARCVATAVAVAAAVGADVETDERWIELDYGDLDGVPLADVPTDLWAHWRGDVTWRPPGGETLVELGVRVRAACADLAAGDDDRDIVVVTHVSPVKAAVAWSLGVDDSVTWRMFVAPGTVSRIAVRDGTPSLLAFNERPPALAGSAGPAE
jgi:broad specificity phosphatase PhoE